MAKHADSPADTVSLRTGATMPVLGLGTWQLTDDTAGAVKASGHRVRCPRSTRSSGRRSAGAGRCSATATVTAS